MKGEITLLIQGYKKTEKDLLEFLRDNYKVLKANIKLKPKNEQAVFYAEQTKDQETKYFILESKGLSLSDLTYKIVIQFDVQKVRVILLERSYELVYNIAQEKQRNLLQVIRKQPATYQKVNTTSSYGDSRAKFEFSQKVIDRDVDMNSFLEDFVKFDEWIEGIVKEAVREDAMMIYQGQVTSVEDMVLKPTLTEFEVEDRVSFRHIGLKKQRG